MSNYIFNKRDPQINLVGVAIGNGLPNPWVQYSAYAEYALMNRLITFNDYLRLLPQFRQCETMMQFGVEGGRAQCDALFGQIITGSSASYDMSNTDTSQNKFNCYDITKPCFGALCYNFSYMDEFLNQEKILKALGVPEGKRWESCNSSVGDHMAKFDWSKNAAPKLIDLLNNGIKVLMYHGDLDFICNWVGGEKAIDGVEWVGQGEWMKTKYVNIGFGLARKYKNLGFIKFSNAGHMVPMDQPESALEMINTLM